MVEPSTLLAHQARQSPLTVFAVICHITDIIQIQHPYARQTDRYAATEYFCGQRMRLQIIRSAGTQQAEEQEHAQISETHIAVTMLSQRIFDGTDDGESAET